MKNVNIVNQKNPGLKKPLKLVSKKSGNLAKKKALIGVLKTMKMG